MDSILPIKIKKRVCKSFNNQLDSTGRNGSNMVQVRRTKMLSRIEPRVILCDLMPRNKADPTVGYLNKNVYADARIIPSNFDSDWYDGGRPPERIYPNGPVEMLNWNSSLSDEDGFGKKTLCIAIRLRMERKTFDLLKASGCSLSAKMKFCPNCGALKFEPEILPKQENRYGPPESDYCAKCQRTL